MVQMFHNFDSEQNLLADILKKELGTTYLADELTPEKAFMELFKAQFSGIENIEPPVPSYSIDSCYLNEDFLEGYYFLLAPLNVDLVESVYCRVFLTDLDEIAKLQTHHCNLYKCGPPYPPPSGSKLAYFTPCFDDSALFFLAFQVQLKENFFFNSENKRYKQGKIMVYELAGISFLTDDENKKIPKNIVILSGEEIRSSAMTIHHIGSLRSHIKTPFFEETELRKSDDYIESIQKTNQELESKIKELKQEFYQFTQTKHRSPIGNEMLGEIMGDFLEKWTTISTERGNRYSLKQKLKAYTLALKDKNFNQ